MKEAIGGTWLFGIVIAFIVFFTTFISVSTNYSRAFKVKDEILTIVEFYKGVNTKSVAKVNDRLKELGYYTTGKCVDNDGEVKSASSKYSNWLGFTTNSTTPIKNSTKSNYCIRRYTVSSQTNGPIGHPTSAYYQIVVFFKLDWPIIGSIFNVRVEGETSVIHMHEDTWAFS